MRLGSREYTNHSVVGVGDIGSTGTERLQCQGSSNCCGTEGHLYYPDGTPVRNFMAGGTTLYMTRGGVNQDSLYLHRDFKFLPNTFVSSGGRSLGLYRCQIPATEVNGEVEILYIGVYRGNSKHRGDVGLSSIN